jgi:hypothetical protein
LVIFDRFDKEYALACSRYFIYKFSDLFICHETQNDASVTKPVDLTYLKLKLLEIHVEVLRGSIINYHCPP